MPELVGAAAQMLGQGFPVVLGEHAGCAAVDELVVIGRVPTDGPRSHREVGTALLDPRKDASTKPTGCPEPEPLLVEVPACSGQNETRYVALMMRRRSLNSSVIGSPLMSRRTSS